MWILSDSFNELRLAFFPEYKPRFLIFTSKIQTYVTTNTLNWSCCFFKDSTSQFKGCKKEEEKVRHREYEA